MKFPIVASLILFVVFLGIRLFVVDKLGKNDRADFLKKESDANNTRKKPLDDLVYINIPLEQLPIHDFGFNKQIQECSERIVSLSSFRIVNFSAMTNTALKLKYGPANLKLLTEYDQNYTSLICTLEKWGHLLCEAGGIKEAVCVLEFAVSIQTDISGTYLLLYQLYTQQGQTERADALLSSIKGLPGSAPRRILHLLRPGQN